MIRVARLVEAVVAMKKFSFLAGLMISCCPLPAEAQSITPPEDQWLSKPWRMGMSAPFSGPASALGTGMREGVEGYFRYVNEHGGIHGRPLELIALDDAYEPVRTAPNMRQLADEKQVFAVIGNVGTPTAAVSVPIANDKKLPLFGAYTGAGILRRNPPDRYVINYRASYAEETAEMVRGLVEELHLQPDQIGFFTQNDAYGDAGWKGAIAALKKLGYSDAESLPHGRYARNTIDIEDGLSRLLDPRFNVRAIIMVGTYRPCARFIQLAKQNGFNPLFLNVSFVGSEALQKQLGDNGEGVVITQVVPLPEGDSDAAREFQSTIELEKRNFISFEGFLAAKALVSAIERAGPNATSETVVDAIESGTPFDLGLGVEHHLSPSEHQFSHQVWPTVIRSGRFQPLLSWPSLTSREAAQ